MNQEQENKMYQCGDCKRIVYLMEAGRSSDLKCCDNAMREMSDEEKIPYQPRFPKPGSP